MFVILLRRSSPPVIYVAALRRDVISRNACTYYDVTSAVRQHDTFIPHQSIGEAGFLEGGTLDRSVLIAREGHFETNNSAGILGSNGSKASLSQHIGLLIKSKLWDMIFFNCH